MNKKHALQLTNDSQHSRRLLRIGLLIGIIIYSLFGILDLYALPTNYHKSWFIRYAIIAPSGIFIYLLTYTSIFERFKRWISLLVIITAQLGIIAMLIVAEPHEEGYLSYYAGLILVILWAGFIFRLTTLNMIITIISNLVFYNVVVIFFQKLPFNPRGSIEFYYFLNNNFILIAGSIFAAIGVNLLNKYGSRLLQQNKLLEVEKKELENAKKKAEESDRLKSAFLTNMSHEIRTPLNAIVGFSDLLSRRQSTGEKQSFYSNIIKTKSKQLLQLINDIIDLSKIESDQIIIESYPVILRSYFQQLEAVYKNMLKTNDKKNLKLILNPCNDLADVTVMMDETRFAQILNNLVGNAIKFTEAGEIEIGCHRRNTKEILVYVRDTGIGIKPEFQDIIFERFRQSDESVTRVFGGTGLGLSIVKNLVEKMQGKIWVESTPGKGSTFYFTLPYIEASPVVRPVYTEVDIEAHEYNWENKKILIAEDETDNFDLLTELLFPTGISISHAINGLEAVRLSSENRYDVILMDIKMPEMDGIEAANAILKTNPDSIIIAQSAYAMHDEKRKAMANGFKGYLTKPIDEGELLKTLAKNLK